MKKWIALFLSLALLLTGCTLGDTAADPNTGSSGDEGTGDGTESADSETGKTNSSAANAQTFDSADMFTAQDYEIGYDEKESIFIVLEGETASCSADSVSVSGSVVTITQQGSYVLSGTLSDGMIVVDAEKTDTIHLVFDGVDICSRSSAAVYILQADKVFFSLAPGSENYLENGGSFAADDANNVDAVIFSKDDLTLNGTGTLCIDSPAGHGIVSKDNLVLTSGTYSITAAGHGIAGKDSIRIAGGSFIMDVGKDGIHAENSEDSSLGFLYIAGGTFSVTADGDGCSASASAYLKDGSFEIQTGGGSASVTHSENGWAWGQWTQPDSSTDTVSAKGIKCAEILTICGGEYILDTADDALHSNGDLSVTGGNFAIAAGDDALHADGLVSIDGGEIVISKSYEGIEGLSVEISGGEIDIVSSDDGINAAGGNDDSGFGGFGGFDSGPFAESSDSSVSICGGIIRINASGDGIDSNGSLTVSGGETYISGPQDNANAALDYGTQASVTGGLFLAAGSSGMAENFGTDSTQGAMLVSTGSQEAGSTIILSDSDGTVLIRWTAEKAFDCVLLSCPAISQGKTYTLNAGNCTTRISMDSLIYSNAGMGTAGGNGFGGPEGGNMKGFGRPGGNNPKDGRPE